MNVYPKKIKGKLLLIPASVEADKLRGMGKGQEELLIEEVKKTTNRITNCVGILKAIKVFISILIQFTKFCNTEIKI